MVRLTLPVSKAFLILMALAAHAEPPMEQTRTYTGYAFGLEGDWLLYTEEHVERYRGGLIEHEVVYRDPERKVIAEKEIDYSQSRIAPSYSARDLRNQRAEGVEPGDRKLLMYSRDEEKPKAGHKSVRMPKELVVDAGFNQYIVSRWDELIAGKRKKIDFAAPALARCVSFVVYKVDEIEIAGRKAYRFRMKTESLLFRLFSDPIDVSYCADTKRLLAYEGLSNIRNVNDKNYHARIVFPLPDERPEDYLADL